MAERIKPVTNWQMRTEVVKVPVQQQVLVPQTVTVHVPVTTHRVVNEEHISRVAVGGQGVPSLSPGSNPTAVAAPFRPLNQPAPSPSAASRTSSKIRRAWVAITNGDRRLPRFVKTSWAASSNRVAFNYGNNSHIHRSASPRVTASGFAA